MASAMAAAASCQLLELVVVLLVCSASEAEQQVQQRPQQQGERKLLELLDELDNPNECGQILLASQLQSSVFYRFPRLVPLAQHFVNHPKDFNQTLLDNCTFSRVPPFALNYSQPSPIYALQYRCAEHGGGIARWVPTLVFHTDDEFANGRQKVYITIRMDYDIDLCGKLNCNTKCQWTVHQGLRISARQCCTRDELICRGSDTYTLTSGGRNVLLFFNALCAVGCLIMMVVIYQQRRKQHEARGWALMELFLFGASILYSMLLLDWIAPPEMGCCIAVWLRQIGFCIFYGSIVLKIYRNLQEYRVRKAQHVSVREKDMIKILVMLLVVTVTGLMAWTVGAWSDQDLWKVAWPQCRMQPWQFIWHVYEMGFLSYGMLLCYKARNSDWLERWQFTVAVCLEAVITFVANMIRYWMRNSGSSDTLFMVSFVQLQLTVSIIIVIIIAPKFVISGESTRRSMTLGGHSGRAHPSLAKLRDNILNGTIDFAEVPISDMNPEDIRAELKRVYTQLRMYKLKNLYQDNPHISKKRGGKKWSDKTAKNRRISLQNCSPQNKRIEEDEKSDLTVESAPHNVYLSTYKLQLEPNHSVRV